MASWSPRQAAEFKADAAALFCERLAASEQARRGLHRLLGIAGSHGRSEVAIAGFKLNSPSPAEQSGSGNDERAGKEARQSSSGKRTRKKTDARKQKEQEKLEAKWQERRQQEQQVSNSLSAQAPPSLPSSGAVNQTPPPPPTLVPPPPPPRESDAVPRNGHSLNIPPGMTQSDLHEAIKAEMARIANATRADVGKMLQGMLQAESQFILGTSSSYGGPATEHERSLHKLEWLMAFEREARARSAPSIHMEPEWSDGGAPT